MFIDPPQFKQWSGCRVDITDFVVMQFARPEVNAFAHHHPDQQCLRFTGQAFEIANEGLLLDAQHIGVAKLKPIKHLHEVVEVIERIVKRVCSHGSSGQGYRVLVMHTDTSFTQSGANGKGSMAAQSAIFSGWENFLPIHDTNRDSAAADRTGRAVSFTQER
ncbi:hypothetical protein D3C81_1182770 [compost metagenome]